MEKEFILKSLNDLFPNPKCELNYNNEWHLLIAILLSAQCTDKKVNKVTPTLFAKYPTLKHLEQANFNELEQIIHPLGLSNNKAKNIINLAKALNEEHNGFVPNNKEKLIKLPGIGTKTANVMLIEYFKIPAFPVDTHVSRVSKRLNLCLESDNVTTIEKKITKTFDKDTWARLHLQMVLFGRYICKAIKPECTNCPFNKICSYTEKKNP